MCLGTFAAVIAGRFSGSPLPANTELAGAVSTGNGGSRVGRRGAEGVVNEIGHRNSRYGDMWNIRVPAAPILIV